MSKFHRTCGPTVWKDKDGEFHGACTRKLSGGMICCIEFTGGRCHADRKAGPRDVPNDGNPAPDWCPYLAGMIRDARVIDKMDDLGLRAHVKGDLLKVIRAMPKSMRPNGARGLGLMALQKAIFDACAAGWEVRV